MGSACDGVCSNITGALSARYPSKSHSSQGERDERHSSTLGARFGQEREEEKEHLGDAGREKERCQDQLAGDGTPDVDVESSTTGTCLGKLTPDWRARDATAGSDGGVTLYPRSPSLPPSPFPYPGPKPRIPDLAM